MISLLQKIFCIRCDGRVDCGDKTDEEDCGRAVILSSYNKAMTPPPLSGSNQVKVEMSMRLQSVLSLDEIGQIMALLHQLGTPTSTSLTSLPLWLQHPPSFCSVRKITFRSFRSTRPFGLVP